MKTIFITLLLGGWISFAYTQDVLLFQFPESNSSLNPALISGKRCPTVLSQFQFNTKLKNQLYRVEFAAPLKTSFSIGLSFINENDVNWNRNNSRLQLNLGYIYKITRELSLSPAIGISGNSMNSYSSDIPFRFNPDTLYSKNLNSTSTANLDLNSGFVLFGPQFLLGASVDHLLKAKSINSNGVEEKGFRLLYNFHGYYLFTNGDKYSKKNISVRPNFIYRFSQINNPSLDKKSSLINYNLLYVGADLYYSGFSLGGGIRLVSDSPKLFYTNIGFKKANFEAYISYAFGTANFELNNQIESSIKYTFPCKPKRRSFRTISCPSFGDMPIVGSYGQQKPQITDPKTKGTLDSTFNTETYDRIYENPFVKPINEPLSTFSVDVDNASYTNVRRMINQGSVVVKDAVRIEEFLNNFTYQYPEPKQGETFSVSTEYAECPWNPEHKLLRIGIRAKDVSFDSIPPSHLIFLIDVSGSMNEDNKIGLLKQSFKLLVEKLREQDLVSIVTYASGIKEVLTAENNKEKIITAIDSLKAEGSTNGEQGLQMAYRIAEKNFIKKGNNRVILATDGDFNVGISNDGDLVRFIEEKRKSGISISILGYGMGNYKDSKMEKISNAGNGNYSYIDNLSEAKRKLVTEFGGTMFIVAKDMKLQVEFNPAEVEAYRLIGYENRMLKAQDFNDDNKDAGDVGANHMVTAIYEIIPANSKSASYDTLPKVDDLKYQKSQIKYSAKHNDELATVKIRFKNNSDTTSQLQEFILKNNSVDFALASQDFKFASSVAAFAMLLRESEYKGIISIDKIIEMATESIGDDPSGQRKEFVELMKKWKLSSKKK